MQKEKKNYWLHRLAGMITLSVSAAADAQTAPPVPDTLRVKEVVIAATRSEQDPATTGRSVTIISADEIKKNGDATLADALARQEGIYIVGGTQTPGSNQSLFTRGAGSNQTVIMIDGVRLTDPSSVNNTPDLSELSLADVDRIEIVRGSHSTMFGSAAVGGVVNIITRRSLQPGFHATIQATGGTFGKSTSTFSENAALNYTFKNGLYINADVYNANVSGLDATVDTVTVPVPNSPARDRDRFDKMDVAARLGFRNAKWDAYGSYRLSQQVADIDDRAYGDDNNYTLDFNRNLVTYGLAFKPNENFGVRFYGGFTQLERFSVDDSSVINTSTQETDHTFTDGLYNGTQATNELQLNYRRKGLDLVAGGGMYSETMNNLLHTHISNWNYHDTIDLDSLNLGISTFNGFVRAGLDGGLFNENWSRFGLGLGARFNQHSVFGSQLTYEINPTVKLGEQGMLFGVYSTGFNAASLYQMYAPDKDFVSGITRGNEDLSPETSQSWELGFKQQVSDKMSIGGSVFHTEVKNLIEYVYLWEKNTQVDSLTYLDYRGDRYLNVGTMITRGAEAHIHSQLNEKVSVDAQLTLTGGKLVYSPDDVDTSQTHGHHVQLYSNGAFAFKEVESVGLVRRPSTARLQLNWMPVKALRLQAAVRYVGARGDIYYNAAGGPFGSLASQAVEDYTLLDGAAHYTFKKYASVLLRVENLLDKKYSEINGFTTRGRGVYVTFRFEM